MLRTWRSAGLRKSHRLGTRYAIAADLNLATRLPAVDAPGKSPRLTLWLGKAGREKSRINYE